MRYAYLSYYGEDLWPAPASAAFRQSKHMYEIRVDDTQSLLIAHCSHCPLLMLLMHAYWLQTHHIHLRCDWRMKTHISHSFRLSHCRMISYILASFKSSSRLFFSFLFLFLLHFFLVHFIGIFSIHSVWARHIERACVPYANANVHFLEMFSFLLCVIKDTILLFIKYQT